MEEKKRCTQVESEGRERGGCKKGERWRKRRERRHCGMYKRRERDREKEREIKSKKGGTVRSNKGRYMGIEKRGTETARY